MDELNPTTVRLTKKAQDIKEDLAPIFGLKNILSAGLVLLGKLPAEQKQKIITEACKNSEPPPQKAQEIRECIEMVKHFVKYQIPSEEEARLIASLRKLLGPEKRQKKKAKGG